MIVVAVAVTYCCYRRSYHRRVTSLAGQTSLLVGGALSYRCLALAMIMAYHERRYCQQRETASILAVTLRLNTTIIFTLIIIIQQARPREWRQRDGEISRWWRAMALLRPRRAAGITFVAGAMPPPSSYR